MESWGCSREALLFSAVRVLSEDRKAYDNTGLEDAMGSWDLVMNHFEIDEANDYSIGVVSGQVVGKAELSVYVL